MNIGDEVYAVDGGYGIVRHGFITGESFAHNASNQTMTVYAVSYNDNPYPPFVSYPEWGRHTERELFEERGQALAYSGYLRREV